MHRFRCRAARDAGGTAGCHCAKPGDPGRQGARTHVAGRNRRIRAGDGTVARDRPRSRLETARSVRGRGRRGNRRAGRRVPMTASARGQRVACAKLRRPPPEDVPECPGVADPRTGLLPLRHLPRRRLLATEGWAWKTPRCRPPPHAWWGWRRPRAVSPRRADCCGSWPGCASRPSRSSVPPKPWDARSPPMNAANPHPTRSVPATTAWSSWRCWAYAPPSTLPSAFAKRVYLRHRGPPCRLGDGAAWIWRLSAEQFPGAIEIVDIYHAKQHLCDVAKAVYGAGTELADAWAKDRHAELDAGRLFPGTKNESNYRRASMPRRCAAGTTWPKRGSRCTARCPRRLDLAQGITLHGGGPGL